MSLLNLYLRVSRFPRSKGQPPPSMSNESYRKECRGSRFSSPDRIFRARGLTLIELVFVLAIAVTMTAVAVPVIQSALISFRLSAAVQTVTSAIASTRYQALRFGYPFQVALTAATLNYQVWSEPTTSTGPAAAYSKVGNSVPLSGSPITLNANTTLQLNPDGTVQFIAGGAGFALNAPTLTLSYAGKTATVTVSSVGYVTTQTQ